MPVIFVFTDSNTQKNTSKNQNISGHICWFLCTVLQKFFVKFSASLPVSQLSASKLHCHYPCDTSLFCLFGLEDPMSGISSQSVTVLTNINFRDYFSWVFLLLYSLTSCNILNLMMKEAGKRGMFQSGCVITEEASISRKPCGSLQGTPMEYIPYLPPALGLALVREVTKLT